MSEQTTEPNIVDAVKKLQEELCEARALLDGSDQLKALMEYCETEARTRAAELALDCVPNYVMPDKSWVPDEIREALTVAREVMRKAWLPRCQRSARKKAADALHKAMRDVGAKESSKAKGE